MRHSVRTRLVYVNDFVHNVHVPLVIDTAEAMLNFFRHVCPCISLRGSRVYRYTITQ
jgi:hypothetical protein